jgi:hypothetical protein
MCIKRALNQCKLVRGGETTHMGVSQGGRNIVLEFPSREQAEAWYHSKAYQSIIQSKE